MLQARFWLINTLQVSAKIQKDKEESKGVKLFLLSGCLLLVGVAEVTLQEAWKEIPLRNMAVEIILLSSFPSAQIIPTLSRKKYPTNKTKQNQKKTHKNPNNQRGPLKLGWHLVFGEQLKCFLCLLTHLYKQTSICEDLHGS